MHSDRDPRAPEPSSSPTFFEPAMAPIPTPPPLPPGAPPPTSFPSSVEAPENVETSRRIPRWRWFVALLLIGFYPAFLSLLGEVLTVRHKRSASSPALPSTTRGLMLYIALDMAVFGALWGLAWLFSRSTKDELLLRWRGGVWKPIWQGFGWAIGLRLAIAVGAIFVLMLALIAYTAAGHDPKTLTHLLEANRPKTDTLFAPNALQNPLYLLLTTTLLSFVAAGLREELWRTSCLAALRHLLPQRWSQRALWGASIALSSVIFGLGHVYQGALGVVMTGVIGAGLGLLTWRNRSIWPSVFAHGFFDATSFLMAAAVAAKKINLH